MSVLGREYRALLSAEALLALGKAHLAKIRGTLFWGPYNKDPAILGSPIFGNPHVLLIERVRGFWDLVNAGISKASRLLWLVRAPIRGLVSTL